MTPFPCLKCGAPRVGDSDLCIAHGGRVVPLPPIRKKMTKLNAEINLHLGKLADKNKSAMECEHGYEVSIETCESCPRVIKELRFRAERLEEQIASTCDLMNTWAREIGGVEECRYPYDSLNLKKLADRLWVETISRILK